MVSRVSRRSLASAFAIVGAAIALEILPSCASPGSLDTDGTGQRSGRVLFERRCCVCHALPIPASRTAADWRRVMERMAVEAKLDNADKARIVEWLISARAGSEHRPASAVRSWER